MDGALPLGRRHGNGPAVRPASAAGNGPRRRGCDPQLPARPRFLRSAVAPTGCRARWSAGAFPARGAPVRHNRQETVAPTRATASACFVSRNLSRAARSRVRLNDRASGLKERAPDGHAPSQLICAGNQA